MANTSRSRENLTPAARQRSVESALFAVSGLLWRDWRDERRPLVERRGQRFPLVKTADRIVTELTCVTVKEVELIPLYGLLLLLLWTEIFITTVPGSVLPAGVFIPFPYCEAIQKPKLGVCTPSQSLTQRRKNRMTFESDNKCDKILTLPNT